MSLRSVGGGVVDGSRIDGSFMSLFTAEPVESGYA